MDNLNFFKSFLEADGEAPDAAMAADSAPDVPDISSTPDDLPDIGGDDSPPDFGEDDIGGGDESGDSEGDIPPDFGEDDMGGDEFGGEEEGSDGDEEQKQEPLDLDEKVSAIMNAKLYSRFLTMLNNLGSQMNQLKQNSDMIYSLSPEASNILSKYKNLDDNIRLYLKNSFIDENYSSNILFFNKCLNLLKLLNDSFSSYVNKGFKERK